MSYFKANRKSQTFNCCLLRQKAHNTNVKERGTLEK